jgi:hypothetical protein
MPSVSERSRLRGHDQGYLRIIESDSTGDARIINGKRIPPRSNAANELMLDLTPKYTLAPGRKELYGATSLPLATGIPWGIARLDGIDYDIRGGIELRTVVDAMPGYVPENQLNAPDSVVSRVNGIRTPDVPIAAIHILMFAELDETSSDERPYSFVILHYSDGTSARLPLVIHRGISSGTLSHSVPIAWSQSDHLRLTGVVQQRLVTSLRLANPYTEKRIKSLDLEAAFDTFSEPVFFAITAEPVISTTSSGKTMQGTH